MLRTIVITENRPKSHKEHESKPQYCRNKELSASKVTRIVNQKILKD